MGSDMMGWIEVGSLRQEHTWLKDEGGGVFSQVSERCEPYVEWTAVIDAGSLVLRYYNMFGLLFGVCNYVGFPPVAPARGLPPDASRQVLAEHAMDTGEDDGEDEGTGADETWILWSEVEAIDWDLSVVNGRGARAYKRLPDGNLTPATEHEVGGLSGKLPPGVEYVEGATWEEGGFVLRIERISRRQVLEGRKEWPLLFDLMARLAADYGDDHVRLVVWFG